MNKAQELLNLLGEGTFWPKSNLPNSFEILLKGELQKNKISGIIIIGSDVFLSGRKLFTINKDVDSVDSVVKRIKKKTK